MYRSTFSLTSTLTRDEWSASPPGKESRDTWIGGYVGPKAGLDEVEKRKFLTLSGLELHFTARNQSLYRLLYGDSGLF
jgi:hypothetical protein